MEEGIRSILSANLKALMAATPGRSTLPEITAAGGPTNGTLDRIRRAATGYGIDQLDLLAEAFNMQPWQLLVPGLDPRNLPILAPMTDRERRAYNRLRDTVQELGDILQASKQASPIEASAATTIAEFVAESQAGVIARSVVRGELGSKTAVAASAASPASPKRRRTPAKQK